MSNTLKIILLDDELPGLAYLKMLCEQIEGVEIIKVFNNPFEFVSQIEHLEFDIAILDIEMPGLNGLEIALHLQNKPVIFCTAYQQYAADAFDMEAIDYIRKPISADRLKKAIHKAQNYLGSIQERNKMHITVNTHRGKSILYFDTILSVTTSDIDKRDKIALLNDGNSIIIKNISFQKLLKILPSDMFCQVNKKEIIAIKTVNHFVFDQITTSILSEDGKNKIFQLGTSYRNAFLACLGEV